MKSSDLQIRVYFEDTDAGGIVYYARYLAFYERARAELLRESSIEQVKLALECGLGFAVRRINVDYFLPARLDDLITIRTEITSISNATITMKQSAINSSGRVINSAEVLLACINIDKMRAMTIPEAVHQKLS